MTTQIPGSPGDELRAYYGCRQLQAAGLNPVPAYDEQGRQNGLVAIDPDEFADWLDDLYADPDYEPCDCENKEGDD